jgi:hypothetical protein
MAVTSIYKQIVRIKGVPGLSFSSLDQQQKQQTERTPVFNETDTKDQRLSISVQGDNFKRRKSPETFSCFFLPLCKMEVTVVKCNKEVTFLFFTLV